MIRKKRKEKKEPMQKNWWMEKNANKLPNKIVGFLLKISNYLPAKSKHFIVYGTGQIILPLSRLFSILSMKSSDLYQIEGIDKKSDKKLILLIASNKETRSFFKKLLFNKILNEKYYGMLTYKKIREKIIQKMISYDIAIIKSDVYYRQLYQNQGFFTIPEKISFIKYLPTNMNDLKESFSNEIKNELNQNLSDNYNYEICSDIRYFTLFYNEMYKPYIQWKHHSMANIVSYQSILSLYHCGAKILFIKENNHILFGGIFLKRKNRIITYYAAFIKDKFDYLEKGITTLSYYFLMKYAIEHNISSIDFGMANPFLEDGLFKYKSKWNMNIEKASPIFSKLYALKFKSNSSSVRGFLMHNPFIMYKNDKLIGMFFSQSKKGNELEKKKHINTLKGLSDICYTRPRDFLE